MVTSTRALVHAAAPPVGLVEVRTVPLPCTATQSDVDGHEIFEIHVEESNVVRAQAPAPPLGLVDTNRLSAEPPARHSVVDGHATVSIWLNVFTAATLHAPVP